MDSYQNGMDFNTDEKKVKKSQTNQRIDPDEFMKKFNEAMRDHFHEIVAANAEKERQERLIFNTH